MFKLSCQGKDSFFACDNEEQLDKCVSLHLNSEHAPPCILFRVLLHTQTHTHIYIYIYIYLHLHTITPFLLQSIRWMDGIKETIYNASSGGKTVSSSLEEPEASLASPTPLASDC